MPSARTSRPLSRSTTGRLAVRWISIVCSGCLRRTVTAATWDWSTKPQPIRRPRCPPICGGSRSSRSSTRLGYCPPRGEKPFLRIARTGSSLGVVAALLILAANAGSQAPSSRFYNTVKQKLAEGEQVVGGTVVLPDPDLYCAMANPGFDFTWIEMQHSPLTYQDVARMIMACKGASAIPFIRVPDATEGDIQKATDIGALGIILPMVDTVEKAAAAVKFARDPPAGRGSQGNGQAGALGGSDYRDTANRNLMIG